MRKKSESEGDAGVYKVVQYVVDNSDMYMFKQQYIRRGKVGDYIYDDQLLKTQRPEDEVIPVRFRVEHTYEIFEKLGAWWGGWNCCPDWSTMRDKAMEWYVRFGAELQTISHDTVIFSCRKLSEEEADILYSDIATFAPDSLTIASEETIKKRLLLDGEFTLWWD